MPPTVNAPETVLVAVRLTAAAKAVQSKWTGVTWIDQALKVPLPAGHWFAAAENTSATSADQVPLVLVP